jgi:hypothetical protein
MTSPDCFIGVGLDSEHYRVVSRNLHSFRRIGMEGVGQHVPERILAGLGKVSIEGLEDSEVETYIAEVGDNLLGVCYVQRLPGFEVVWNPKLGEMIIRKKLD